MVMKTMVRVDLYNIWRRFLFDAKEQAFWSDSWARVYKREGQMASAHLHEGIFHSPRYIMT